MNVSASALTAWRWLVAGLDGVNGFTRRSQGHTMGIRVGSDSGYCVVENGILRS